MKLGINIIPVMPIEEILALIRNAEELGYEYCLLADEGLTPDVYALLAIAARETTRIRLAPVTNGFTRHPAVTATAIATLQELSKGRAFLVLVAGGSIVLDKLNIKRTKPLQVVTETIEICRALWTGNDVNYSGENFGLNNAKLEIGNQTIPIWIAARGDRMLEMAGQISDGILLMVKPDIGPALKQVGDSQHRLVRAYMDRMAYTEGMIEDTTRIFPFVIKDTPERQLRGFLTEDEIISVRSALSEGGGGVEAISRLVNADMIKRYKIAGTKEECRSAVTEIEHKHALDVFIVNITTPRLADNIAMLREVRQIITGQTE